MKKLFFGDDIDKAKRIARLLHKVTGKKVYIGNGNGFFVNTSPEKDAYCEIGEGSQNK